MSGVVTCLGPQCCSKWLTGPIYYEYGSTCLAQYPAYFFAAALKNSSSCYCKITDDKILMYIIDLGNEARSLNAKLLVLQPFAAIPVIRCRACPVSTHRMKTLLHGLCGQELHTTFQSESMYLSTSHDANCIPNSSPNKWRAFL